MHLHGSSPPGPVDRLAASGGTHAVDAIWDRHAGQAGGDLGGDPFGVEGLGGRVGPVGLRKVLVSPGESDVAE
ncbi:hypothetical protein GCM10017779_58460 [Streptomyces capillispiralis]|nr:hypothetical protein GCM10017779_58460 [Streptomyces capillispiralis]